MREDEESLRPRVYKIADDVKALQLDGARRDERITSLTSNIESVRVSMATGEQLTALTKLLDVKMDALANAVGTFRNGVNWAVGIVLAGFILAVLNMIINGTPRQ